MNVKGNREVEVFYGLTKEKDVNWNFKLIEKDLRM